MCIMKINPINNNLQNNTSFQKGIYFTESPTVLFNKSAKFDSLKKETISISNDGFRYIENKSIPNKIKTAILNNAFVKDIAESFDTFVYVRKPFKCPDFDNFCSHLKIKWFDSEKNKVETRDVVGLNPNSEKFAANTMLNKLRLQEFF